MQGADLRDALIVIRSAGPENTTGKQSLKGALLEGAHVVIDAQGLDHNRAIALFSFKSEENFRNELSSRGDEQADRPLSARDLAISPAVGLVDLIASIDGEKYPALKRSVALQVLQLAHSWTDQIPNLFKYSPLLQSVLGDPVLSSDPDVLQEVERATEKATGGSM